MSILIFLAVGLVFIFTSIFFLILITPTKADKERENEEQMEFIRLYNEKRIATLSK